MCAGRVADGDRYLMEYNNTVELSECLDKLDATESLVKASLRG